MTANLHHNPIYINRLSFNNGAGERSRTPDLLITNELLYQAKTSFADLRH